MKVIEYATPADYKISLAKEGYPQVSVNALTGELDYDAQRTLRPFHEKRNGGKIYMHTPDDYPLHKGIVSTDRWEDL